MLQSKKLTLALLINAALVSTAFASEQSESKGFVEDANGSVLFRTGYLNRDKKDGLTNDTSSAAQTAIVNLDSGFTKGIVGFGAGIIGDASFKLGENGHTGNQMIPLIVKIMPMVLKMPMTIGHVVALMSKHAYQTQQLNMVRKYLNYQ